MKIIMQKYQQNGQEFYSAVMPFQEIDRVSEVLVYAESEYGYQRMPDPKHYQSIKNSLLNNKDSLPTSIILSVDKHEFNKYISPLSLDGYQNPDLYEFDTTDITNEIFRIVDGQHRIYGLREASEQDSAFLMFPLNVIIVITDEHERVKEVVIFRDINSKAKKLKTDLTLLAMYNYELINQQKLTNHTDLMKHLLIRTAHYLNENNKSVWKNAIQFDIHEQPVQGIIGVAAITNSLKPLIKKYIESKSFDLSSDIYSHSNDVISLLNSHALTLSDIIIEAWERVKQKWPKCFGDVEKQFLGEPRYNKAYYIQKTTGANAIHSILEENIDFSAQPNFEMLKDFYSVIGKSPLEHEDWAVGGKLSGLTSKSGFTKTKRIIEIGFENYQLEQEKKRKQ
ncbi:DGQHR domain-containing protein [Chryseomicrobium imtechense]